MFLQQSLQSKPKKRSKKVNRRPAEKEGIESRNRLQ
jgi:hypothetical protein